MEISTIQSSVYYNYTATDINSTLVGTFTTSSIPVIEVDGMYVTTNILSTVTTYINSTDTVTETVYRTITETVYDTVTETKTITETVYDTVTETATFTSSRSYVSSTDSRSTSSRGYADAAKAAYSLTKYTYDIDGWATLKLVDNYYRVVQGNCKHTEMTSSFSQYSTMSGNSIISSYESSSMSSSTRNEEISFKVVGTFPFYDQYMVEAITATSITTYRLGLTQSSGSTTSQTYSYTSYWNHAGSWIFLYGYMNDYVFSGNFFRRVMYKPSYPSLFNHYVESTTSLSFTKTQSDLSYALSIKDYNTTLSSRKSSSYTFTYYG